MAQDLFHFFWRVAIDQEPSPGFGLQRAAGMPHRDRARLPGEIRHAREHVADETQQSRSVARLPLPLFLAASEVRLDAGRVLIARDVRRALAQEKRHGAVPEIRER